MSPSIPPLAPWKLRSALMGAGKAEGEPQALDSSSIKAKAFFFFNFHLFPGSFLSGGVFLGATQRAAQDPESKELCAGWMARSGVAIFCHNYAGIGCLLGLPLPVLDGSQAHGPYGRGIWV